MQRPRKNLRRTDTSALGRVPGGARAAAAAALAPGLVVSLIALSAGPAYPATFGGDGPGGTVSVGASGGTSSPGGAGGAAGSGGGGGSGTGSGDAGGGRGGSSGGGGGGSMDQPTCTDTPLTLNDGGGFAPGGPTPGGWYSVTCVYPGPAGAMTTVTEWIPDAGAGPAAAAPATPAVDPRTLALQAERSIQLPLPVPHTNPTAEAVVNLPTWLWIDPAAWAPVSVSASAGSVSATAVATPVSVLWSMGDGATVPCTGPGTAFDTAVPAADQSTSCSYTYPISSAGQPAPDGDPDDAAFTVTVTITWSVSWTSQGAAGGGALPGLTTEATFPLPVEQVESVNSGLTSLVHPDPSTGARSDRWRRHADPRPQEGLQ